MNAAQTATAALTPYAVAALGPAVAWLAWISWSGARASTAMNVLFFATVALGCLIAGYLSNRRVPQLAALIVIAVIAVLTTLFLWWSSEDATGLFGVGILLATPLVVVGAAALVLAGSAGAGRRASGPARA